MNKTLLMIITLLVTTSNMHAYTYNYINGTNKTLYFDPQGAGLASWFTFFEGNSSANDGWSVKGPQIIKPGESKRYTFKGVFCSGGIKVGTSPSNMTDTTRVEADKTQYKQILSTDFTKQKATLRSKNKGLSFCGAQLDPADKLQCGDISFIIGEKDDGSFFTTITHYLE